MNAKLKRIGGESLHGPHTTNSSAAQFHCDDRRR